MESKKTNKILENRLDSVCPRDPNRQREQSCSKHVKDCDSQPSENKEIQAAQDKLRSPAECVEEKLFH